MALRPRTTRALLLAFLLISFHSVTAQVVAGIAANGRIISQGDTVNVCQGNAITFQSVAQGSINITWRFQQGSATVGNGLGPFPITYNVAGFDTVFQKITDGNFADSTF